MSLATYLEGCAFFLPTLGSIGLAAVLLVRRRFPFLSGVARAVALGVLGTALLIAAHVLPGLVGAISRWSVLAVALALAGGALLLSPLRGQREARPPRPVPASPPISRFLAAGGAGLLIVYVLASTIGLAAMPPTNLDALTFHIPGIARWIQSGSLLQIDQFVPDVATGHYPGNGNVVELAAVLPWRSDFLFRLVHVPFLALLCAALYATGVELGAPRATAVLLACAAGATPALLTYVVPRPLPDVILLATFASGVLFLVRHARSRLRGDLVLAGIALGIAFGVKWYGVTSVPFVLLFWAGASLLAGRPPRAVVRQSALLGGLVLAIGGFWLLRNLVESGNPFFPARVELAGLTIFDAPPDPRGAEALSSIADYLDDREALADHVLPQLRSALGVPGLLLVGGAAAALAAGVTGGGKLLRRVARPGPALALCALALAAVYVLTPSSAPGPIGRPLDVDANARYAVPALLLATGATAALGGRLRRGSRLALELLALAALVAGLLDAFRPSRGDTVVAALVVAAVAGGVALARSRRPIPAPAVAAATLLAVISLGYAVEKRFHQRGYAREATVAWVLTHAPEGERIGMAGAWGIDVVSPVRGLFGPRLRNHVAYVGSFEEGTLRAHRSPGRFRKALSERRYALVIIGRGEKRVRPVVREERWVQAAGFRQVARSDRLTLYAVPSAARRAITVGGGPR